MIGKWVGEKRRRGELVERASKGRRRKEVERRRKKRNEESEIDIEKTEERYE